MKPSQVSAYLRQIASQIDASRRPSKDLVVRDLRRLVARVAAEPSGVPEVVAGPTKQQLQDHAQKFGRFVVRMKRRGAWDRNLDGMGGRFKTREEAEAKMAELQSVFPDAEWRIDEQ